MITAFGEVIIRGDHGDADEGVGTTVEVHGEIAAASLEITSGRDDDVVSFHMTTGGAPATVLTFEGDDTILAKAFDGETFVDGGPDNDTLVGPDDGRTYYIGGHNSGWTGLLTFINIENLIGGLGDDIFIFLDGAYLDGVLEGGGGLMFTDRAGLRRQVLRLACDERLRLALGGNLKTYLDEVVSWEVVVRQYNEAYDLARKARTQGEPVVLPTVF